jgi:cyclopropane fatty-acyl-phospholipid synthase-like methyltransferase
MRSIDLAGFEAKFANDGDPWSTWTNRDEAVKRAAILHALGSGRQGRVLELGAGNGSNSVALAQRAMRLDATEATAAGKALVASAIANHLPRARASLLVVPDAPPRSAYDAIVIAELLYYLDLQAMDRLARQMVRLLRPGGQLVLAHHRITFYDFAQRAAGIQDRFLRATGSRWLTRVVQRTGRWLVVACRPVG